MLVGKRGAHPQRPRLALIVSSQENPRIVLGTASRLPPSPIAPVGVGNYKAQGITKRAEHVPPDSLQRHSIQRQRREPGDDPLRLESPPPEDQISCPSRMALPSHGQNPVEPAEVRPQTTASTPSFPRRGPLLGPRGQFPPADQELTQGIVDIRPRRTTRHRVVVLIPRESVVPIRLPRLPKKHLIRHGRRHHRGFLPPALLLPYLLPAPECPSICTARPSPGAGSGQ